MKIDGKQIANQILQNLKKDIQNLKVKGIFPKLAIILVGEDPASVAYVKRKEIKAKEIGIEAEVQRLPENISQDKLLKIIKQYDKDKKIHGIIIQQPLPKQIDTPLIVSAVSANKDIDGFLPNSKFQMPIAMAVLKILEEIHARLILDQGSTLTKWLKTKRIVVIGKGDTGGKPIAKMLKKLGIKPLIVDSKTKSPENIIKTADIIISAVGKPDTIKPSMLKEGVILIGIGIARDRSARLTGDYDQNEVEDIASFYTPTPGGVGPVNVVMLLKNLVTVASNLA